MASIITFWIASYGVGGPQPPASDILPDLSLGRVWENFAADTATHALREVRLPENLTPLVLRIADFKNVLVR